MLCAPRWARFLLFLTVLGLLAPQAWATWSIVVVNRKTGEVGVTSATCIEDLDLRRYLPVIVVGKGAAAAQSFIDPQGGNRQQIWLGLEAGYPPERILQMLGGTDSGHATRQYGIVSRVGAPVTFTGSGAGLARLGVVGSIGDLDYAIQGNVLTGEPVILAAEAAFRNTDGDMAERMMQAMEAARALGGDGRCSCAPNTPTACGVPPQNFTHSAYIGFFIVARPGDTDGVCNGTMGCANGDYYAHFNVQGNASTLDPVLVLRQEYDAWRAGLAGIPDAFQSEVALSSEVLIADGVHQVSAVVTLKDLDGLPVTTAGHTLEVIPSAGRPITSATTVTALSPGVFRVTWTASSLPGRAAFALRVVSPNGDRIALRPEVRLHARRPAPITFGRARLQASMRAELPVWLQIPSAAGCSYRILGSLSGTSPGTPYQGVTVPLVGDAFFAWTQTLTGQSPFLHSVGTLDAQGRAEATLTLPSGRLLPFVGRTLSVAAVTTCSTAQQASPPASLLIEW